MTIEGVGLSQVAPPDVLQPPALFEEPVPSVRHEPVPPHVEVDGAGERDGAVKFHVASQDHGLVAQPVAKDGLLTGPRQRRKV